MQKLECQNLGKHCCCYIFLTSWHPSEAATALLLESLPTGEMESVRFLKVH